MKKRIQNTLCVLLCAVLALGSLSFAAVAADTSGTLESGAKWTFAGGKLTVTGSGAIPDGELNAAIAEFADQITSVSVGEGITSLGRSAFRRCAKLMAVSLPKTLRAVSYGCFSYCEALTAVSVPAGVQVIEGSAFMGCAKLGSAALPSTLSAIGDSAFRGCKALKSVALPSGLTSLGNECFMESGLTSVVLPASVRYVGGWAFAQCASLKNAILSAGLAFLPDCVFQNSALEYIVLPKSIAAVNEGAFYNCTLKTVYYEGTQAEFRNIKIVNGAGIENVPGTTSELFQSAAVKTADVKTDLQKSRGDLDGKDGVTSADARGVLRIAVALDNVAPGTAAYYTADVDRDADVTAADARLVLRSAVSLEDLPSLKPTRPKAVPAQTLTSLGGFQGNMTALAEAYEVQGLYIAPMTFGEAMAVFRGEAQTAVLLMNNSGTYFNHSFTPTVASDAFKTVGKGTSSEAVAAIDPGTVFNVFSGLGGAVTSASISCTTDGAVYLITYSGGNVSSVTVY